MRQFATHLRAQARAYDVIARVGGEEFVVLLDQTDREQSVQAAERLRLGVSDQVMKIGSHSIPMTVSIGLATLESGDKNFNDLLRRADQALYAAKANGRNRVEAAKEDSTVGV